MSLKNDIEAIGLDKVIMMVEVKKKDQAILKLIADLKKKG